MGVDEFTGELGRQIEPFLRGADDFVILDIFRAHFRRDFHIPAGAFGGDFDVELFAADELSVGHVSSIAVR